MDLTLQQFGIDRLAPRERLELINLIWDSIPESEPYHPPEWHLQELQRRVAAADANPDNVEPWEAVFDRLSKKP